MPLINFHSHRLPRETGRVTGPRSNQKTTSDDDESDDFVDMDLEPQVRSVAPAIVGLLGVISLVLSVAAAVILVFGSVLDGHLSADETLVALVGALGVLAGGVLIWAVLRVVTRMVELAERADIQRLAILDQLRRLPD
jgi:hypothetical protein